MNIVYLWYIKHYRLGAWYVSGLTEYSSTPCPPGHWCSGLGPPILCPAGTRRPLPGAAAPNQCEPCAGGTFCPDSRATGMPNINGIPCRASYQCPAGRFVMFASGCNSVKMGCCKKALIVLQVQWQRGCAELAHIVGLRLLSLKCVLKVIFVLRDPIPTTPPNKCKWMEGLIDQNL